MNIRFVPWITRLAIAVIALTSLTLGSSLPAQATSCPANVAGFQATGSSYTICDFRAWDFTGLTITNVDFSMSYLGGAQFGRNGLTRTSLDGVHFGNVISTNVNFNHADILNSTFSFTNMNDSDFSDTVFVGGTFSNAYFQNASFINADLSSVTFNDPWLDGANLSYSNVTQSQLDHAHLSASTICPDTFPLGDHVGNCFSALKAPIPTTTAPIVSANGFTFDITNNNTDYYTFTVAVTSGPGVASTGTPTGSTLPIVVTGAPPGSNTIVTITGSIGSGGSQVVSSTTYNYQDEISKELARTGVSGDGAAWLLGSGTMLLLIGGTAFYFSRRKSTN